MLFLCFWAWHQSPFLGHFCQFFPFFLFVRFYRSRLHSLFAQKVSQDYHNFIHCICLFYRSYDILQFKLSHLTPTPILLNAFYFIILFTFMRAFLINKLYSHELSNDILHCTEVSFHFS